MDVRKLLLEIWDIEGELKKLPGYEDLNYYVQSTQGEFLVKISDGKADDLLLMQVKAMEFMGYEVRYKELDHCTVRLLPWVKGEVWATAAFKPPALFHDLGEKAGEHFLKLSGFEHDAARRDQYPWDLAEAMWVESELSFYDDANQKLISHFLDRFRALRNSYSKLPKAVIHNDMNNYNILVDKGKVAGFIDYGDLCYSQRINEVAILLAYAMMDTINPIDAAIPILRGFSSKFALATEEIECLFTLIAMRLCVSFVASRQAMVDNPDNEYLAISREPAINLLQKLRKADETLATYRFKQACGLPIPDNTTKFEQWVATAKTSKVCSMLPNDYYVLDLGVGSTELGHETQYNNPVIHEQNIAKILDEKSKAYGIGSYNEVRPLYSSNDFSEIGNEGQRWRTVHIGLDFFHDAGTEVYAFADGVVHAVKYNEGDKNYGNTVILRHEGCYTLYGHLSSKTLEHLSKGQRVEAGDQIAWFGEPHENGNWAPHLHFQIILDMLGCKDDFPGVCHFDERETWTAICPDPRPYLGISSVQKSTQQAHEITQSRKESLGRSYSLSYDKPLHIVRAQGQYLYDHTGRKFLDCVNNVPHVGHQNIKVVDAGMKQMQVLNTNTRYLHTNIVDLADKLTNTLPTNLRICHFVNSGSEANELAIRMARAATGRHAVVAMQHGYHGNTSLCVDMSSYKFNGKGGEGQKDYIQLVPMPDPVRTGSPVRFTLDQQKEVPAAFIHESILSCGGQVVMPERFFADLYGEFRKQGVVMIADEVQTGLGRIGSCMWAFEAEGIMPDIVTIGKPFGNGHPIAAVVCTEEIADAFHNGMEYFNTFGGNPVSCAIASEVLRIVEDEGLQKHAFDLGQFITAQLQELKEEYPIIADVRGRGLFLGWEFADRETNEPLAAQATFFVNEMKRFGVLLSTDGPFHNVIKFKPPMVFNRTDAEYMLRYMRQVVSTML